MDDQGTWPVPLSAQDGTDARAFDRQMMDEIRSDPQALQEIGGVKGNVLIVLVPLLAAIAAVVLLLQWMRDGSWVWPAILSVVLIVAGVVWIGRLRAVMGQARQVLGQAATGSVGYGIGIIRELRIGGDGRRRRRPRGPRRWRGPERRRGRRDLRRPRRGWLLDHGPVRDADPADEFELSEDEDDDLSSVEVQLTLSATRGGASPSRPSSPSATPPSMPCAWSAASTVRCATCCAPETTAAVDASLSPDAVQRLYRAAALNG